MSRELFITLTLLSILAVTAAFGIRSEIKLSNTQEELAAVRALPSLPYSRPHLEFQGKHNEPCAAWMFVELGIYFIICDQQPPTAMAVSDVHNMSHRPTY